MNNEYECKVDDEKNKNRYILDKSRKTPYEVKKIKVPKGLKDLSEFAYEFKNQLPRELVFVI